jgi:hypothetical protein
VSAVVEPVFCDGCGQPIPGRVRVHPENYHGATCRSKAHRRPLAAVETVHRAPSALLALEPLLLRCVRGGADPYLTLSLVIWPPKSTHEARDLFAASELRKAGELGGMAA